MLTLTTARILIVSQKETDEAYLRDFFERLEGVPEPTFILNKIVPADKYDFIIFNASSIAAVPNITAFTSLPEDDQAYLGLIDRYLDKTTKYILFYGKYLFSLNQDRCPSANSKFTLYARICELIDFINHYKN